MPRLLVMIAVLLVFWLLRTDPQTRPQPVLVLRPQRGASGCAVFGLVLLALCALIPLGLVLLERLPMISLNSQDTIVLGLCFFGVIAATIIGIVRLATQRKD